MAYHQITFAPNNRWSWGLGHWYLRGGFVGNGETTLSTQHDVLPFERQLGRARAARFQLDGRAVAVDQFYTLYRDMRSWTARADVPRD